MKTFHSDDLKNFTIADFMKANSEAFDDAEMTDIVTQLESLAINESMRLNLGCCGVFTIKRIQ